MSRLIIFLFTISLIFFNPPVQAQKDLYNPSKYYTIQELKEDFSFFPVIEVFSRFSLVS